MSERRRLSDSSDDCDFCAIVRGDAPAEIVCEGETWLAFIPLEPATPGHTLIVPRRHVEDFWRLDSEAACELADAVLRVGHAVESALRPEGLNLITSAGKAAQQTVYHLHLHVVPRWVDDDMGRIWPLESYVSKRDERDAAARIRAACKATLDEQGD